MLALNYRTRLILVAKKFVSSEFTGYMFW